MDQARRRGCFPGKRRRLPHLAAGGRFYGHGFRTCRRPPVTPCASTGRPWRNRITGSITHPCSMNWRAGRIWPFAAGPEGPFARPRTIPRGRARNVGKKPPRSTPGTDMSRPRPPTSAMVCALFREGTGPISGPKGRFHHAGVPVRWRPHGGDGLRPCLSAVVEALVAQDTVRAHGAHVGCFSKSENQCSLKRKKRKAVPHLPHSP